MEQTMRLELGHWYFSYEEQNGANNETWVRSNASNAMDPKNVLKWVMGELHWNRFLDFVWKMLLFYFFSLF